MEVHDIHRYPPPQRFRRGKTSTVASERQIPSLNLIQSLTSAFLAPVTTPFLMNAMQILADKIRGSGNTENAEASRWMSRSGAELY
jgi:hypothetical protein